MKAFRAADLLRGGVLLLLGSQVTLGQTGAADADARSGIDMQYVDSTVRPQDDFYRYVNGKWLDVTDIPPDRPAYGTATKLFDDTERRLRQIIEQAAQRANTAGGEASGSEAWTDGNDALDSDAAKIGTLYNSFLDVARIERLGSRPLAPELARIAAMRSRRDIAALMAHLQQIGVTVPYSLSVHPDGRNAARFMCDLQQDGLGLPDRDYYIRDDDPTLRLILHQYQMLVATSLGRLGDHDAPAEAAAIVALETELARAQWAKEDNRDPIRTYNTFDVASLGAMTPGYDWHRYMVDAGIAGKISQVIVSQPSYLRAFGQILAQTPLSTWKAYFRWHLLSDFSPYLSQAYVDAVFAFYGTVLQGAPHDQPRWRRGVRLVDESIGQGLGRLYVARYFPAQGRARAQTLIANLLQAYREDIGSLSWMAPETKAEAALKLANIAIKIGYPDHWRDYASLQFGEQDLVGNIMRARRFEYRRNIDKLGRPVDRTIWESTPQSVNAFYNAQMNEIVVPAAVLQPPFFDPAADDAANYGGIGMIMGHEISHAFDAQGSRYDESGNLRDWWTAEDHARFAALTRPLVAEYGAFTPIRGRHLDGELTLNENIADNAGLAIAYKAYHLSLAGRAAPVIDGLSGDERFYMGFAQAWREKLRDSFAVELIQSDPHAISYVRVIGALMNQSAFDQTFDVKPGDRMYLSPDRRVVIW
ncbi:MAG TPA: M13 family metallopeptidase [Steroidobacteraceae bacterium]